MDENKKLNEESPEQLTMEELHKVPGGTEVNYESGDAGDAGSDITLPGITIKKPES